MKAIKNCTTAANNTAVKQSGLSTEEAKQQGIGCKKWQSSLMSLWCRNKESLVIEAVAQWAMDHKLIKHRRFDNSKDGLMVPRDDVDAYLEGYEEPGGEEDDAGRGD